MTKTPKNYRLSRMAIDAIKSIMKREKMTTETEAVETALIKYNHLKSTDKILKKN